VPRMTGRVYLSDDGRSGYHTCGATPLPTVIDRYFVKHRTTPLILTVYSRLDRGDGNVALKGAGGRVLHIVVTAPPAFVDMRLTDALVFHFPSICGSYNSLAIRSYRLVMFLTDLLTELNHHTRCPWTHLACRPAALFTKSQVGGGPNVLALRAPQLSTRQHDR